MAVTETAARGGLTNLEHGGPSGIVLRAGDREEDVRHFRGDLRRVGVAIVQRIEMAPDFGPHLVLLLRVADRRHRLALARRMGATLRDAGINWNLAPVVDVARTPSWQLTQRLSSNGATNVS